MQWAFTQKLTMHVLHQTWLSVFKAARQHVDNVDTPDPRQGDPHCGGSVSFEAAVCFRPTKIRRTFESRVQPIVLHNKLKVGGQRRSPRLQLHLTSNCPHVRVMIRASVVKTCVALTRVNVAWVYFFHFPAFRCQVQTLPAISQDEMRLKC